MNLDILIPAALVAIPATIASVAAFIQARSTHKAVNSRMDELLALAKAESAAQATLDEKTAERARKGEAAIQSQRDKSTNQQGSE